MKHFIIRPKIISFTPNITETLEPNKPIVLTFNMKIRPGYGTKSAIINGGVYNPQPGLTMKYLASFDNETYKDEIHTLYQFPIINRLLWLFDPKFLFFGIKNIGKVEGIDEPSKNINIYIKATWTPSSREEVDKFRGKKNIVGGTFHFIPSSPYGIFEYPIYIFGILVIFNFLLAIFRFLIESYIFP